MRTYKEIVKNYILIFDKYLVLSILINFIFAGINIVDAVFV